MTTPTSEALDEALEEAPDRMCTPLDSSRLSGVTAQEDARCMRVIRDAIAELRAERADWARRFTLNDVTPWEWMTRAKRDEQDAERYRYLLQCDPEEFISDCTDVHDWSLLETKEQIDAAVDAAIKKYPEFRGRT